MRRTLCGALAALALASGCSGVAAPDASLPPAQSPSQPSVAASAAVARPIRVEVPQRGIDGEVLVEGLGLDESGGHAEPPVDEPMLASWYNLGPRPGEDGPAVVLGHVNGGGRDGIFANLDQVQAGDRIVVHREDISIVAFEVYRTQLVDKIAFPASEVYGPVPGPEIRLITCGGGFSNGSYLQNVIVYARLV